MRGFKLVLSLAAVASILLTTTAPSAARDGEAPGEWPTKGWRTSAPEAQGMDSRLLAKALDRVRTSDPNVHSLLVVRNGVLVLDAYFPPYGPGLLHDIASNTKSVTATLVGAALERGLIKDLRQPVLDFFPGRTITHCDEAKKSMTLEDLLTMRSGLACVNQPTEVTLFRMMASPDWVRFMLDLPVTDKPGTKFAYSSGAVHLLSAVIRRASGRSALEFAREALFGPLGISDVVWPAGAQGDNCGWGTLRLLPHDMAKIGYLYLRDGVWEGKRILPSGWVKTATARQVVFDDAKGYGYLWWISSAGSYNASGRGGQYIFVVPERDLVTVMTGGGSSIPPEKIVCDLIIPSIKRADGPLPADAEAAALLESSISRAASTPPLRAEPAGPLPDGAKAVSGKTFVLEANALGLLAMTPTFVDEKEALIRIDMAFDTDRSPEYRLGLDNVPRSAPGRFGMPAAGSGRWLPDGSFSLFVDEVGNINKLRMTLTFEGDGLTGKLMEATGLGSVVLRGKAKTS